MPFINVTDTLSVEQLTEPVDQIAVFNASTSDSLLEGYINGEATPSINLPIGTGSSFVRRGAISSLKFKMYGGSVGFVALNKIKA